eukprot:GHVN01037727.1.p1 GENE.GHVN01037727.1~~GHVN01037727.1.p1  ORF type:complete len:672 (+),score=111.35 GHVN01037727.1:280-2295(+)
MLQRDEAPAALKRQGGSKGNDRSARRPIRWFVKRVFLCALFFVITQMLVVYVTFNEKDKVELNNKLTPITRLVNPKNNTINVHVAFPRIVGSNQWPLQGFDQVRQNIVYIIAAEPLLARYKATVTSFTSPYPSISSIGTDILITIDFLIDYKMTFEFSPLFKPTRAPNASSNSPLRQRRFTVTNREVHNVYLDYWGQPHIDFHPNPSRRLAGLLRCLSVQASSTNATMSDASCHRLAIETQKYNFTSSRQWVLNRIANSTENQSVRSLLERWGEVVIDVPSPVKGRFFTAEYCQIDENDSNRPLWNDDVGDRLKRLSLFMTNQNGARNTAIDTMLDAGADWVAALDGNAVFTADGFQGLFSALVKAEMFDAQYTLLPMYRYLHDLDTLHSIANSHRSKSDKLRLNKPLRLFRVSEWLPQLSRFNGASDEYDITPSRLPTMSDLLAHHHITRQEAQLVFHRSSIERYSRDMGYGRQNKLALLRTLVTKKRKDTHNSVSDGTMRSRYRQTEQGSHGKNGLPLEVVMCAEGYGGGYQRPHMDNQVELKEMTACGAVLRLPYHTPDVNVMQLFKAAAPANPHRSWSAVRNFLHLQIRLFEARMWGLWSTVVPHRWRTDSYPRNAAMRSAMRRMSSEAFKPQLRDVCQAAVTISQRLSEVWGVEAETDETVRQSKW